MKPQVNMFMQIRSKNSLCALNGELACTRVCVSPAAVILAVTLVPAGLSQFCTNTLNPVQ